MRRRVHGSKGSRPGAGWPAAIGAVLLIAAAAVVWRLGGAQGGIATKPAAHAPARPASFHPLTAQQVAALPEARYDAVIPGLLGYTSGTRPASDRAYTISSDTPIYDQQRDPVARFGFTDFAGRPTVVAVVRFDGPWALVLTPARRVLPSAADGAAPAQTAGWVRADALHPTEELRARIVVSVSAQQLRIEDLEGNVVQSYDVAVGAPGTPTPTGVTGYLEERYLDARQGQTQYPIQLTSLHATAQDEPYAGEDGGLIGMHYLADHAGAISHGCIRLSEQAVVAVDALPLGTSVTIDP